jgi:hypothetical protein
MTPNGKVRIQSTTAIRFHTADEITTTADVTNVDNTYGRVWAYAALRPFGQNHKGSTWYIQGGYNYKQLTYKPTGAMLNGSAGGALAIQFGNPEGNGCHLPTLEVEQDDTTTIVEVAVAP